MRCTPSGSRRAGGQLEAPSDTDYGLREGRHVDPDGDVNGLLTALRAKCRGGVNNRNGHYPKTVKTEIGEVELRVPRDRNSTFEPRTVRKGQRRLVGLTGNVISLYAKGLTTGDIQALAEIYGTEVSRDTISWITDAVVEDLVAWQNRPLDAVYPVLLTDAIHFKIRDGQVANRPVYLAMGRRGPLGARHETDRDLGRDLGRGRDRRHGTLLADLHASRRNFTSTMPRTARRRERSANWHAARIGRLLFG